MNELITWSVASHPPSLLKLLNLWPNKFDLVSPLPPSLIEFLRARPEIPLRCPGPLSIDWLVQPSSTEAECNAERMTDCERGDCARRLKAKPPVFLLSLNAPSFFHPSPLRTRFSSLIRPSVYQGFDLCIKYVSICHLVLRLLIDVTQYQTQYQTAGQ